MTKRKRIPQETETDVLTKSARRCCICFGLEANFAEIQGQIAHLDGDPSNADFENLAWLCLPHHDKYDSTTRQSKGLSIREVKKYRASLYEAVDQMRKGFLLTASPAGLDVPRLDFVQEIPPLNGIPTKGVRFTDRGLTGSDGLPTLYLSVYFKTSRLFGGHLPPSNEKWLYLQADMHFAFSLRIQVRAWNNRDVSELMGFLSNYEDRYLADFERNLGDNSLKQQILRQRRTAGWDLHGPRPDNNENGSGDYFRVWKENDENRLMVSTFMPTHAAISIHARFSSDVAKAFTNYLEEVGFAKPF